MEEIYEEKVDCPPASFYDDRSSGVWIYQIRSTEGTKDKFVEDTGCLSGM